MIIQVRKSHFSERGFSLAELMTVVAIIGILATVAVPTYDAMVAKSRQSEAKTQLAAMFSTEQLIFAENTSFSCCLDQAGYEPIGKSFYLTGFWMAGCIWTYDFGNGGMCSVNTVPWNGTYRNDATFLMNVWANPGLQGSYAGGSWNATATTFRVVAFGSISSSSPLFDIWTIDQAKNITNDQSGI